MSQTMVRVTPKDFAPPSFIDRMRIRSLVVGVVFSVVALGLTLGFAQWDLFLRSWLFSFMFWLRTHHRFPCIAHAAIHQRRKLGSSGSPHLGSRSEQLVADGRCSGFPLLLA